MHVENFPCQGFYVSELDLDAGDMVGPGRWGETIARIGPRHIRYSTEHQLEARRRAAHPDKPSRLDSNFCFATIEEARWYRDTHHEGQKIYEIGFDADNFAFHQGFILCIPPHSSMSDKEAIESYWRCDTRVYDAGRPDIAPIEIVTRSQMRIRRRVE